MTSEDEGRYNIYFDKTIHLSDILYSSQTIISATQSRKKQQTELVRSVLFAEKDKKRKERENLPITSLPVELLAAQEPSLSNAAQEQDQDEGKN